MSIEYDHVIVCGDFNANAFDAAKFSKLNIINDYMSLLNDTCPTYVAGNFHPSQLDLMFTKNKIDVKHFGHFPAVGTSNHQAIYCILNFFTTKGEIKSYSFRNFNDIDEQKVVKFIEESG